MPSVKSLLAASVTAAAAVGLAGAALAAGSHLHTLTVNLPDGGVAVIRYAGDVPPKVTLAPGAALPAAWVAGPMSDWAAPFAALDRIAAQMDRQADAMLTMAMDGAAPGAPGASIIDFGRMPAGAQSFSFVSSGPGGHACGRSTEVISQGPGQAPRVFSRSWGDCAGGRAPVSGGATGPAATSVLGAPQPAQPRADSPHLTVASLDR